MIGAIFLIVCVTIATSFSIYTILKINNLLDEINKEIKDMEKQQ
jgi:hypothetical protein